MNLATRCAIGLVVLLMTGAASAATVTVGSDPNKVIIKGTLVTPDQVVDGELVIEGDTITCVAASCTAPPGATRITVTNAYIFPGFVDAHNHVAYNVLPRWTPPKLYKNRSQWQGSDAYKVFKKPYDDLTNKGLTCEMIKYGEVKGLAHGKSHGRGVLVGAQGPDTFAAGSFVPDSFVTLTSCGRRPRSTKRTSTEPSPTSSGSR